MEIPREEMENDAEARTQRKEGIFYIILKTLVEKPQKFLNRGEFLLDF